MSNSKDEILVRAGLGEEMLADAEKEKLKELIKRQLEKFKNDEISEEKLIQILLNHIKAFAKEK